jgi:hypothetical protein
MNILIDTEEKKIKIDTQSINFTELRKLYDITLSIDEFYVRRWKIEFKDKKN